MKKPSQNSNRPSAIQAMGNLRMRLLDLTARNRLINFRHTKIGSLRIIDELPNQLVETLLTDTKMRFLAIPEPTEKELIEAGYLEVDEESQQTVRLRKDPTADEWAKHLGFAAGYEVPEPSLNDDSSKHSDTAIQTLLYPYEMEARLKSLLQTAESAIQEMGANILYFSFGFLEWFDTNNGEHPRIAPLFLVPIILHKGRLNRKTGTYEYRLSYSGEDIIPNLSLREKLRADFGMALPDLDENTVPEDYFRKVQALIKDKQPHWQVRRYISLALLNFSKLMMYLDLDPARWPKDTNIIDHPVVSRFLVGNDQVADAKNNAAGNFGFGEEYLIDEMDDVHANYPLIDDADSSQHSALIDAVDGQNLVIEGPPGTGKSQTITNLIVAVMAQGKKVLFVAEKLAALEVVRRRLDAVGLGEFCLELHSHKSQKRKVLDEVEYRLKKHGGYRKPKDIEVDIARYEELKNALKTYAGKINRLWGNTGRTLHEIFMAATRYRNTIGINPEKFHPKGYNGNMYTAMVQRNNEDQVEVYCRVYQAVTGQFDTNTTLQEYPWCGVKNGDLQIFDLDRVKDSLGKWQESLQHLSSEREQITHTLDCELPDVADSLSGITAFLNELECIPALEGDEVLEILPVLHGEVLEKTQRYLKLFIDVQGLYVPLAKKIGPEILQNLTVVDQLLTGSEQLKKLVGHNVELGDLAKAINRLTASQDQLEQLDESLQGVVDALGEPVGEHLTISESGLTEFKIVIELISSLNSSYWQHRDELFDNEELDELLPLLRKDLEDLKKLHEVVHGVFALEALPSENDIQQQRSTLAAGGPLRWFKGEWRAARTRILSYAANPQVKFSNLKLILGDFAEFSGKHHAFEGNTRYQKAFGSQLHGLETNLAGLESLREWYKRVRQQYGVGFGRKVALGEAILGLPQNIGRAVRSLSERGINQQLSDLLDDLNSLKEIFSPVVELRNDSTLLVGEEGVIPCLLCSVVDAIRVCGPLVNDDSVSMAELADRIEQIELLKQKVDTWQEADFDRKIFQGRLRLEVGVDVDNTAGLSTLRHTLELAACVDGQLTNRMLVNHIYEHPTDSTFTSLVALARGCDTLKLTS